MTYRRYSASSSHCHLRAMSPNSVKAGAFDVQDAAASAAAAAPARLHSRRGGKHDVMLRPPGGARPDVDAAQPMKRAEAVSRCGALRPPSGAPLRCFTGHLYHLRRNTTLSIFRLECTKSLMKSLLPNSTMHAVAYEGGGGRHFISFSANTCDRAATPVIERPHLLAGAAAQRGGAGAARAYC